MGTVCGKLDFQCAVCATALFAICVFLALPCYGQANEDSVGSETEFVTTVPEMTEAEKKAEMEAKMKVEAEKRAEVVAEAEKAERPEEGRSPTLVRLALFVLDVDQVDSAQQTYTAGIFIEARWNDPRLTHEGRSIQKQLDDIWNPRLQLLNQQKLWTTFPNTVEVLGDGEVIYRQRFWGSFSQPFKLRPFPFDHQFLTTQILAVGYSTDEIQIEELQRDGARLMGIAPEFSLPDWDVVGWESTAKPIEVVQGLPGVPGLDFRLEVARRPGYYIIKVILPLCLIVAMSWVSFWIDPEEIGVNVSVAITSVLTIVAYCFAISTSLPKLSYLTRMDAFVMGSLIMVFLTVGQVVINSTLVKGGHIRIAHSLDRGARLMYPLCFGAMTYWTLFQW